MATIRISFSITLQTKNHVRNSEYRIVLVFVMLPRHYNVLFLRLLLQAALVEVHCRIACTRILSLGSLKLHS